MKTAKQNAQSPSRKVMETPTCNQGKGKMLNQKTLEYPQNSSPTHIICHWQLCAYLRKVEFDKNTSASKATVPIIAHQLNNTILLVEFEVLHEAQLP